MNIGMPTTTNGAVSPIARDKASIPPVKMPGIAAGRTTFNIVCHFVAPIPNEASLKSRGTARMASWAATMMTGRTSRLIVKPAANMDRSKARARTKNR